MVLTAERIPTEEISSLIPNLSFKREKYGSGEDTSEVSIQEVFKDFSIKYASRDEANEAMLLEGILLQEELVKSYYNDDLDRMEKLANWAEALNRENFYRPENEIDPEKSARNPEAFRVGFLGETATIITLKDMQLEVFKATFEDDIDGSIDLFFKTDLGGEKVVCPTQVKVRGALNKAIAIPLDKLESLKERDWLEERITDTWEAEDEIKNTVGQTRTNMLKYLEENKEDIERDFPNLKIKPIAIVIPGGQTKHAVFSITTGVPGSLEGNNYFNQLYDEFDKLGMWEEEIE